MNRRNLLALLGGTAALWPLAGAAQPAKVPTIGVQVGSRSRAERFMRCYRIRSTSARSRTRAPATAGSTRQFSIARHGTACRTSSVTQPQSNEDGQLALAAH